MRITFLYLFSFLSTKFWGLDRTIQLLKKVGMFFNRFSHCQENRASLALALSRALHRIPLAVKCLDQAIVAWYVLNRNSHPATLKIGISITPIESHAWVDCEGEVFVSTYNLADLSVVAEYGPWIQNLSARPEVPSF